MVLDPGVFEPDTDTPFQKIRIRIHAFKEAGSDLPEDTDPDQSFFSTGSGSDRFRIRPVPDPTGSAALLPPRKLYTYSNELQEMEHGENIILVKV